MARRGGEGGERSRVSLSRVRVQSIDAGCEAGFPPLLLSHVYVHWSCYSTRERRPPRDESAREWAGGRALRRAPKQKRRPGQTTPDTMARPPDPITPLFGVALMPHEGAMPLPPRPPLCACLTPRASHLLSLSCNQSQAPLPVFATSLLVQPWWRPPARAGRQARAIRARAGPCAPPRAPS